MKEILVVWTLNTLQSNPSLFGGDNGNPAIILQYLKETSTNDSVTTMTYETISNAVTVSRFKNKLLSRYPELDHRDKNKPKYKEGIHPNQGVLFSIRDYVSDSENKILDYLEADEIRWTYPISRIKKSIRGVESSEIECVLKHRDLYQMETNKAQKQDLKHDIEETKKEASNAVGDKL